MYHHLRLDPWPKPGAERTKSQRGTPPPAKGRPTLSEVKSPVLKHNRVLLPANPSSEATAMGNSSAHQSPTVVTSACPESLLGPRAAVTPRYHRVSNFSLLVQRRVACVYVRLVSLRRVCEESNMKAMIQNKGPHHDPRAPVFPSFWPAIVLKHTTVALGKHLVEPVGIP